MTSLSTEEIKLITDMANIALSNSAKAFSTFINQPVYISATEVPFDNKGDDKTGTRAVNILLSEIMGDFKGKCYLNFNEKEAQKLFECALPPEYQKEEEMCNAILMELDNILTAAVVTMFSNILKVNIYAYVPNLFKITYKQFDAMLEEDAKKSYFGIRFKTSFEIHGLDLFPEFIWLLEPQVLTALMERTKEGSLNLNEHLEKLKS